MNHRNILDKIQNELKNVEYPNNPCVNQKFADVPIRSPYKDKIISSINKSSEKIYSFEVNYNDINKTVIPNFYSNFGKNLMNKFENINSEINLKNSNIADLNSYSNNYKDEEEKYKKELEIIKKRNVNISLHSRNHNLDFPNNNCISTQINLSDKNLKQEQEINNAIEPNLHNYMNISNNLNNDFDIIDLCSEKAILQSFYIKSNLIQNSEKGEEEKIDLINHTVNEINNSKLFDTGSMKKIDSQFVDDYLQIRDLEIFCQNSTFKNSEIQRVFKFKEELELNRDMKEGIEKSLKYFKNIFDNEENFRMVKIGILDKFESYMRKNKIKVFEHLNFDKGLYPLFKNNLFLFRDVMGDGNCFYRAVLFSYLENIIIEKNSIQLLYLINDIKEVLNENSELIKKYKIKKVNSITGLFIVYKILEDSFSVDFTFNENSEYLSKAKNNKNNIFTALSFLILLFNTDKLFDLGLIMYLRIKIKIFIEANKDKLYTKEFSVKMGNLLPEKYEINYDKFDWQGFYSENLLNLYSEAENIIIYVIPFIFKVNLNIYTYEIGNNFLEKFKGINCFLENKQTISLFYRKMHYEIVYSEDFYLRNKGFIDENALNLENILNSICDEKKNNFKRFERKEYKEHDRFELNNIESMNFSKHSIKNSNNENHVNNFSKENFNIYDINNVSNIQQPNKNFYNEEELINSKNININNFSNQINTVKSNIDLTYKSSILICFHCKKFLPIKNNQNNQHNQTLKNFDSDYFVVKDLNIFICIECIEKEFSSAITAKYLDAYYKNIDNFNDPQYHEFTTIIPQYKINLNCKNETFESNVKNFVEGIQLNFSDYSSPVNFSEIKSFLKIHNEVEIFNNIKSCFCIFCQKQNDYSYSLDSSNLIIPCKCSFCSRRCLFKFFYKYFKYKKIFYNNQTNYDFTCICGYRYNTLQTISLMEILLLKNKNTNLMFINNDDIKENEYNQINDFLKKCLNLLLIKKFDRLCFKCSVWLTDDMIKIKVFIDNNYLNLENILNFEFYHYICFNCVIEDIKKIYFEKDYNIKGMADFDMIKRHLEKNSFFCKMCETYHLISKIEENKELLSKSKEENCLIF